MKKVVNNPLSIEEVHIEKLFGFYNYSIPFTKADISKLLILYGDNGCGKTTILNLIFYLLSTKEQSGFKSKICKIKFKKINIRFQNGIEIGAERSLSDFGTYTYYIRSNDQVLYSVHLVSDETNAINITKQSEEDQREYKRIMDYLGKLNIHTFFLTDDRKIHSSQTSTAHENEYDLNEIISSRGNYSIRDLDSLKRKGFQVKNQLSIEPAIEKLLQWIRNKTIAGSRTGEKNSQVIFSDIIKNYLNLSESENIGKRKEEILKEIEEIEKKTPSFVALGLVEKFETKILKNSVKKANNDEQTKYLSTIIIPFLEGFNAKLAALEKVEKTVNLFISIVNDYFSNKKISFNLNNGFSLSHANGEPITFDCLSSGEKQLLLLLINTIASSEDATIFIIDEPEISLNIKWQRKLIQTLLTFSKDKNIQFILATHSIELLSANRPNVSKLESKDEGI